MANKEKQRLNAEKTAMALAKLGELQAKSQIKTTRKDTVRLIREDRDR